MLPPGPKSRILPQLARWVKEPEAVLIECLEQYGDTFTLRLPLGTSILNPASVVITSHPDAIRQVFTGSSAVYHAGKVNEILRPIVGDNSLLLLDGGRHLEERRLLLPPFHRERMRAYMDIMREETLVQMAEWQPNQEFALHPHLQAITLRVILRAVFGVSGRAMSQLARSLTEVMNAATDPAILVWPMAARRWRERLELSRQMHRTDLMIRRVIRERRESDDHNTRHDVLSMMMSARYADGTAMSDQALRDELMTLLVAGHETTATALAWTVACLLDNPKPMAHAVAEVDDHADTAIHEGSLSSLEYTDAVVKESLRLRPVIPLVGRQLQVPVTVRGFALPANTIIAPSIWLTHRNPALYPKPNEFSPERWLGARANIYNWLPFGGGVRRCIGMSFATSEMKVVLATMLSHSTFTAAAGSDYSMARRGITFAVSDGCRVRALPRRAKSFSAGCAA